MLSEALAQIGRSGARFYEVEVYRIKGAITLQLQVESHKSQVEEAEVCFLKAIAIVQQHAKSLELRAVMSLARPWQGQGKTADAHQTLAEIDHWFTIRVWCQGFARGEGPVRGMNLISTG
jgi:predicted ATPase